MYVYTCTLWHKWKYQTWYSSSHSKHKGLIMWFIEQENVMSWRKALFPGVAATLVEKPTCDFYSTPQQVQRGQINFALCSKAWENLNTVMSVFTISYIILSLFRGFPPLNRNVFLLNRGYHSFCHKFSSSLSYSCLRPVLILRHTANNARMASADGRISGVLTGSHSLQEVTYTHHARASHQAKASHQAPTRRSARRLDHNQKTEGKV